VQKGSGPPPSDIRRYIERMESEGLARVKMFLVITVAYLIFWGPLFLVTLLNWSWEWKDAKKSMSHEVPHMQCFICRIGSPGVPPCGIRPLLRQPAAVCGAAQGLPEGHPRPPLLRLL
jgi:hypothetical protein